MKKLSLYAATALVGFTSLNANAQIDYDTMEMIFGEKVTASATGKPQRVSEAPVDMIIIGQDEIEKSGAQDIPQLLQKYAGINVNRSFKNHADVSIRGNNSPYSNKILTLVNGRQVYQDFYGATVWEFLPVQLNEIRQIEVVKGPNTSLFGLNAEAGVINIITYSPLKDNVSSVEVKSATQDLREAVGVATTKLTENVAVRVSAETKSADLFGSEVMEQSNFTRENGLVKRTYNADLEWQPDSKTNARLQLGHVSGNATQTSPSLTAFDNAHENMEYIQATLSKKTKYGLMKANVYQNETIASIAEMRIDNDLSVIQLENLYQADKKNTFRVGIEARHATAEGTAIGPNEGDELKSNLVGISGMWNHVFNKKLTLTNSVRWDHVEYERFGDQVIGFKLQEDEFDQTIDAFSFNTGAVYKLSDLDTLRFSAGKGLHLPSLVELGGGLSGSKNTYSGVPFLDPEIVYSAEVGYTRTLPKLQGKAKATVFYNFYDDALGRGIAGAGTTGPRPVLYSANAGQSEIAGLELSLDAKYNENIGYGSSYTFTYTKDHPKAIPTGETILYNEDNNPAHKIAVWADYSKDKWNAYAEAIWTSEVDYHSRSNYIGNTEFSKKVDSYVTFNTNVSYDLTENAKVSLSGYNLLDEHPEFPSDYNKDLKLHTGGNEIGRSAVISFKYKF